MGLVFLEAALNRSVAVTIGERERASSKAASNFGEVVARCGMDDLGIMQEDDVMDAHRRTHQPPPIVQDKEDGEYKVITGDAAPASPGGSPHLDFDGGWDDCQGDVENIANIIDDFRGDFLALTEAEVGTGFNDIEIIDSDFSWHADIDIPTSPSPGGETVAVGTEQGVFSTDTPSSTLMSVVAEQTAAEGSVFAMASAVGITAHETGRKDPSGSLSGNNDAETYTHIGVPVATTFNSNGDHGALNMPSTSSLPTASSRAEPETTVAEIAASDASGIIGDVTSSVCIPCRWGKWR